MYLPLAHAGALGVRELAVQDRAVVAPCPVGEWAEVADAATPCII